MMSMEEEGLTEHHADDRVNIIQKYTAVTLNHCRTCAMTESRKEQKQWTVVANFHGLFENSES